MAVIASDRNYVAVLALLPIILGALIRAVPDPAGLAGRNNGNAQQVLLILVMAACLTGVANAVRELVKERAIYTRERAAGLSAGVYLWSKLVVLGLISALQAVVLVLIGVVVGVAGSSVAVRDTRLATQDIYPLSQTPLRYLLSDRIDLLRDTNVVSVTADDLFISVTIEEKQALIGTSRLMMMFDSKTVALKQWTVTDPQGLDTTVAVYDVDTAKKPDPNLFVINYTSNLK